MEQNSINVFFTGCDTNHVKNRPDLKLTIEMYTKLQMEYLFTRTTNISMQTVPGDSNPAKLMATTIVDRQMIDFIDAWTNDTVFDNMSEMSVSFMSINPDGRGGVSALGFTEIKPVFDLYMDQQRKGKWFDKIKEGDEFIFEFEGIMIPGSIHYEIIIKNFVNVNTGDQPPAGDMGAFVHDVALQPENNKGDDQHTNNAEE